MPVVIGEGSRSAIGTVVDYAHYMFNKVHMKCFPKEFTTTQSLVLYVSGDDFIEHNLHGLRVQLIAMV